MSCVGILVITFVGYTIAGNTAWNQFKAKYEKNGLDFDYAAGFRSPPEDQDFLESPTMKGWLNSHDRELVRLLTEYPEGVAHLTRNQIWKTRELKLELEQADQANQILTSFAASESAFAQWVKDTDRPSITVSDEIPNLANIGQFAEILSLRIQANLLAGNPELALDELIAGLRYTQRLREGDTLTFFLVQIALLNKLEDAVWLGFNQRSWNFDQLGRLAKEIDQLTITKNFAKIGFRELSMIPYHIDTHKGARLLKLVTSGCWGWSNYFHGKSWEMAFFDDSGHLPAEYTVEQRNRSNAGETGKKNWFTSFHSLYTPNVGRIGDVALECRQFYDFARYACDLEIYSIEHGRYPVDGEPLGVPLPNDRFLNHSPIKYKLDGDRYQLISVGADEHDDGGKINQDLVWRFSPAPGVIVALE